MDSNQENKITQSVEGEDKLTNVKTLYDASFFEIIWRNVLAGASRAFGALVFYVLFLFVIGVIIGKYLTPVLAPLLTQFQDLTKSLNNVQKINPSNLLR